MSETAPLPSLDERSDGDLVELAREGAKDAFSVLVLRYQDRILSTVTARVGNAETARDLAQEVFIKAYRGLGGFKSQSGFYTWLYRIAINTTLSWRRKALRRGQMASLDRAWKADDGSERRDTPDQGIGPSQDAERREEAGLVRAAISRLEDEYNEVVVLRDLQGLSYDEIASILQCPVGSVKSRLHRARKRLLAELRKVM